MITIAVVGTLDTKGGEHAFVVDCIRAAGHQPLLIDIGTGGSPSVAPDYSREDVRNAVRVSADATAAVASTDRGQAIAAMARWLPSLMQKLQSEGRIQGMISLGGTGGTAIATAAMRSLPLGFPKVMVSTVAGQNVTQYVDISDIVMVPSIVDVSGLNRISRGVFARAASIVCAMAEANQDLVSSPDSKPLILASMFGNTTKCVEHARGLLEQAGYEVLVFHATGSGGRTMESIIGSTEVAGVLDITTTEWADELLGGVMAAGPHRLEAAAINGIPTVVCPGCLDMVNFAGPGTVPSKYQGRLFYQHNPDVTLMRTSPVECAELGKILADKVNLSTGPVSVLIPQRAISVISAEGEAFHDPQADEALFSAIKHHLRSDVDLQEMDCEINDPRFAEACVQALLKNISCR